MSYSKQNAVRKMIALVLSLIMLFGVVAPSLSYAENTEPSGSTLEESTSVIADPMKEEGEEPTLEPPIDQAPTLADWEQAGIHMEQFAYDGMVETAVLKDLEELGYADVIIRLNEQPEMEQLSAAAATITNRVDRIEMVVDQLQQVAESARTSIEPMIRELEAKDLMSHIKPFWIFSGYAARITPEALEYLLGNEEIAMITRDGVLELPEFEVQESSPNLPTWGLENIFAPKVWSEYGLYGEGIVVGIMDSGVQGDHESVKHNYRGREGDHTYSWFDASDNQYTIPTDGHGHGTHVAGTSVGGGEGLPTGVAPKAEWIAAKIFNDAGRASVSGIHEAFEWMMAPGGEPSKAPHVVNNSWGSSAVYNTEYWQDVQAWIAAGIFPLFAAGNDGPGSETVGSPGSFPQTFTIGATDINDQLGDFSSRGPVFWPDENGNAIRHLKPQVSAPGVSILSAYPESRGMGNYVLASGTSMATPHVAGTIALIMQANPELTMFEIMDLLETTARQEYSMGQLPNDLYGHGIIDAYRAVTTAAYAGEVVGSLNDSTGNPISGEISIPSENIHISVPETGEFSFLIREGTYQVELTSFGYHDKTVELTVVKNEVETVSWQLEQAEQFTFSGRVVREDRTPVPYAFIRLHDTPLAVARTDVEGQFAITGIPEDTYQVTVSGYGVISQNYSITIDQDVEREFVMQVSQRITADDWPTANNNIHRNAVTDEVISYEHLVNQWQTDTPGNIIFSSPAVGEGVIVVTTDRGVIVALDQKTGEIKWEVVTGTVNRSSPTIQNGLVYVSGGSDRTIYAINLHTGMIVWTYRPAFQATYESPLYHEGVLFLSAAWTEGAKLTALNAATGEFLWDSEVGDGTVFGASIGDSRLYIGTHDGKTLQALDINDGSVIWTYSHPSEGFASRPVFADGIVYATSTDFTVGTLWAFDAASGEVLWSVDDVGDTQAVSPLVFENLVIQGSAKVAGLKAYDRLTGDLVWRNNQISTMVSNGAISGNGVVFVTDSFNMLHAVDVHTGVTLGRYNLPANSSSGVAITSGQVIVATNRGINTFTSYATFKGYIRDEAGEGLAGKVRLLETDIVAQADDTGYFEVSVPPGTYQVRASMYGYIQETLEITFSSGYEVERDFTLRTGDTGTLQGTVVNQRSGAAMGGVTVRLDDTNLEMTTDETGSFLFEDVYEGSYDLIISATGFIEQIEPVTITASQTTAIEVQLRPVDVAVLDDYENEITKFLNFNNITAEERGWDMIADIDKYQAVYLNGAYRSATAKPTQQALDDLIAAAKENGVSLVFADQWGINWGSLRQLHEYYNDPPIIGSEYMGSLNYLDIDVSHPIFGDWLVGDRVSLYSGEVKWFSQYSGRHLGSILSTRLGPTGSGVAYKAVSEDSAHLLLSTHAATPWVSPVDWFAPQQQILVNGMNYLFDAQFGRFHGTVKNALGEPVQATIEVTETGVRATSQSDGYFEMFHDEGSYTVTVRASGYATQTVTIDFANGTPVSRNIVLEVSDSGVLSGTVSNRITNQPVAQAAIKLYDMEGVLVTEVLSGGNGFYEITNLDEAIYRVEVVVEGFVIETTTVEVTLDTQTYDFLLWPAPRVAIIGDSTTANRNIRAALSEVGITADSLRLTALIPVIESYDVIYFNADTSVTATQMEQLFETADRHQISLIFGDEYSSSNTGLELLNRFRGDPAVRSRHDDRTNEVYYEVIEENMIFDQAEVGERIDIIQPVGARVSSFADYSGYPLANIGHRNQTEAHGLGAAYMPRTGRSMELILSGHGISTWRYLDQYTAAGRRMFVDAVLWATYSEFPTIMGTVSNPEGEALLAEIKIIERDKSVWTNPEEGLFLYSDLAGEYTLEISSFGYQTQTVTVDLTMDTSPLAITLQPDDTVGSLMGQITDEYDSSGVEATLELRDHPRTAGSDVSGNYRIDRLMPGSYELIVKAEGYLQKEIPFEIHPSQDTVLDFTMKPSPTVGIIVDNQYNKNQTLAMYLESRGWNTLSLFYSDLDLLDQVDVVYANSDYQNSLIPSEDVFRRFVKEIDTKRKPVIWTGEHGGRGSIRYLWEHFNNPSEEIRGNSTNSVNTGTIVEDHPIVAGIDQTYDWLAGGYYYAFDGYTGHPVVNYSNSNVGELGMGIAYQGRTIDSVEILLSQFTYGAQFSVDRYFDANRERILNNALLWAIENEEALVGELHGQVNSSTGPGIQAQVSVEETGHIVETEPDGSFFLALDDGTYTLTVSAYGHEAATFTQTFERGVANEETFELVADNSGTITGRISSLANGSPIEGAKLQLVGTPLETVSDEQGNYTLLAPVGSYTLRVTAPSFKPEIIDQITVVQGEATTVDIALGETSQIAVIASTSNRTSISSLLESEGYEVVGYADNATGYEQLLPLVQDYDLIFVNDLLSTFTDDMLRQIVTKAEEFDVSLIFTSQWGGGPINRLTSAYGDPASNTHSNTVSRINYKVVEPHPILAGFDVGQEIPLYDNGTSNQQYNVFFNYSGTLVAELTDASGEVLGGGIAYRYPTANSVHLLLGSMRYGTYTSLTRWTEHTGQIYINAVDWAINTSLGEIRGTVTDSEGQPITGASVAIENGPSTATDVLGEYRLGVGLGTYQLSVSARGYLPAEATVVVDELGVPVVHDFILTKTDRASVFGLVTSASDGLPLADVGLSLKETTTGTVYEEVTNSNGEYAFNDLIAGDYELMVKAIGYRDITRTFSLSDGQQREENFALSSFDTAILGDFRGELAAFLLQNDIAAESRDWSIVEDMYNYNLVIVNTSEGTPEQVERLIEASDQHEVSLVFVDTWSQNSGSIELLAEILGYPQPDKQGYDQGSVYLLPVDHPIYQGFEPGQPIRIHTEKSYYATFKDYPGHIIGDLQVDDINQGNSVAYDFRSENHVHLLLSSFAVNNMIGPNKGWTVDGERFFVQAISWAKTAKQALPSQPMWDENTIITTETQVTASGQADYRDQVDIYVNDTFVETVHPTIDNTFNVTLELAPGRTYQVKAVAKNFAGEVASDTLTIIIADVPVITSPADQTMTNHDAAQIQGQVSVDGLVTIYQDGEAVATAMSSDLTFSAAVVLNEGENVITATLRIADEGTAHSQPITIIRDTVLPVISQIQPAQDVSLRAGESVTISFRSTKSSGSANYQLVIPSASQADLVGTDMPEVEPGLYQAIWTAPEDMTFDLATVSFSHEDAAGNRIYFQAPGRISLGAETQPIELINLKPEQDVVLTAGETVELSFDAPSGGQARYYMALPGAVTDSMALATAMVEGPDGTYRATYTAPANTEFSSALVHFYYLSPEGAVGQASAPGTISVEIEEVLPPEPITLTNLKPLEDVTLLAGEKVELAFDAPSGGVGSYFLSLSNTTAAFELWAIPMTEGPDGTYRATYTAPEDTSFSQASVNFRYVGLDGAVGEATAPGSITVEIEEVIPPEPIRLTELQPDDHITVEAGEQVEVSFQGPSGGSAGYQLVLPIGATEQDLQAISMIEQPAGTYRATWIAPENVQFSRAKVHFEFLSADGLPAGAIAPGSITLVMETPEEPTLPTIERVAGDNRFDTAVLMSQKSFTSADVVVLAYGYNFPDALVGGIYAEKLKAPVLLSNKDAVPAQVMQEIARLGATNVKVLGGELALSEQVVDQLQEAGLLVERIAGANRYQTAIEISRRARSSESRHVYLVSGSNFPDALSIVPVAAREDHPILLTAQQQVDAQTLQAIKDWNTETITLMGGPNVISQRVAEQLTSLGYRVDRVQGTTRYATNIKVASKYYTDPIAAVGASGEDFPDALVSTVYAALKNQPIVLIDPEGLATETVVYLRDGTIHQMTLMGGSLVIPYQIELEIMRLLMQ